MENSITKVFRDEDELRRWYAVFCDGAEDSPESWIGPQSILHGFKLNDEVGVYGEGEDISEIPHTTCFDCGVMSCTGTWNDSLENLLTKFRSAGSIQITIYFDDPLVDPDDWDWRYKNPSEYVKERMVDYNNRREELITPEFLEFLIMLYYDAIVDAFLRADDSEYDVDTTVGQQAKQYIGTLTPENKERLIALMWSDIVASELSEHRDVEIEKSYLRAKEEFEKLVAAEDATLFNQPLEDLLHLEDQA